MPRIDLPALDEDRFLADVLGADTLAAIRSGQVQGLASIYVEELAAFVGVIDVPVVTSFPTLGPAVESTPAEYYVPPGRAHLMTGSPVSFGDAAVVLESGGDLPGAPAQVQSPADVAVSPLSVPEPATALLAVFAAAALAMASRRAGR